MPESESELPSGFAVIENGDVAEVIQNGFPPANARPLFIMRPAYYPEIETLAGPTYEILADKVNATYTRQLQSGALAVAKKIKVQEIRVEGLSRIQAIYPAIVSIDTIILLRDFIQSIVPEARSLVPNLQTANSIYQAGVDAISLIKSKTDPRTIMAYNVKTDPGWP